MTPQHEQPFTLGQMAPLRKRRWWIAALIGVVVLVAAAAGGAIGAGYVLRGQPDSPAAIVQTSTPQVTVSPLSRESACLLLLPLLQRVVDVADAMLDDVAPEQATIDKILDDFRVHEGWWPNEMRPDIDHVVQSVRLMRSGRLEPAPLGAAGLAITDRCRPYVKR